MQCQKCGVKQEHEGKYCVACGETIEFIERPKPHDINEKFRTATGPFVKSHLEFVGFKVEKLSEEAKDRDTLLATHEQRSNLVVFIIRDIVILQANFSGTKNQHPESGKLYEKLNEINQSATTTKWYIKYEPAGEELTLTVEGVSFGYDKIGFGKSLDLLDTEIGKFMPNFKDLVK